MHIAIFGASGATGKLLTRHCLDAGYTVSALVRNPDAFAFNDEARVHVVQGSAFNPTAVAATLEKPAGKADLVLSALGARSLGKEDVLERAIPHIVAAMQAHGVRRIIVLGSAGALPDSLSKQPAWRRWIVENIVYKTLLKYPVASQVSQWHTLSTTDLEWTMVMPPMLTNGAARDRYRIDADSLPRNGSRISRADVANFMMQQISDRQWVRKGVYIAL